MRSVKESEWFSLGNLERQAGEISAQRMAIAKGITQDAGDSQWNPSSQMKFPALLLSLLASSLLPLFAEDTPIVASHSLSENPDGSVQLSLSWSGGEPPFLVQASDTLLPDSFETISDPVQARSFEAQLPAITNVRFFRIVNSPGPEQAEETASFRVVFESVWSRTTFATVPGNEHFSPLVGATHNQNTHLWERGGLASTGIEIMAETGGAGPLIGEIDTLITAGAAGERVTGGAPNVAGTSINTTFEASLTHPFLTLVSMIAPSPDWFVGIDGAPLLDSSGQWKSDMVFDLVAYDAGTDAGPNFTSQNQDNDEPIFRIPATDPNFAPALGSPGQPIPLARFVIERLSP